MLLLLAAAGLAGLPSPPCKELYIFDQANLPSTQGCKQGPVCISRVALATEIEDIMTMHATSEVRSNNLAAGNVCALSGGAVKWMDTKGRGTEPVSPLHQEKKNERPLFWKELAKVTDLGSRWSGCG
eukprot:1158966-Pelagomonas_calceolata.AAC.1